MMMMRQCVKQVASVGSERSVGASADNSGLLIIIFYILQILWPCNCIFYVGASPDNSGLVIIFFYIGLVIVFYIGRVNKNSSNQISQTTQVKIS